MRMIYPLLMTLHVAGVILWIGGAYAAATALLKRARLAEDSTAALTSLERDFLFKGCHPGMLLAIVSGVGMILFNASHFLREGWLHAKLFFALFLVGLSVALTKAHRKLGEPEKGVPERSIIIYRALLSAAAVIILLLVFLRPF
jgi:protoporphyrinogen IX oxidase